MSKGDRLHRLIHSLELNEKRYFKLQSAVQKKESNLVRLFDYLADAKEYNEEDVRKHFEGEKFLDQLAVTQNHLYEAILRTMRSYHLKRSLDYQLHGMLQDVQFLYEKGLAEQATMLLQKVRKIATRNDSFLVLLSVLDWESKLLAESFYVGKDESDIDIISEQYYEILGSLQNEREYIDLQSKIFNNYYKIGTERKNSDHKTNDQIINQFALKDPERALTFRSKCCYLNIHAQYSKINNDWQKAYAYRKEMLALIEPLFGASFNKDINKRYFVALNNLVPICVRLRKWDEVLELVEKMEGIEGRSLKSHFSDELAVRVLLQGSIAKLAIYTRLGMVDQGLAVVESLQQQKEKLSLYHRRYVVLHLYFNIAYFLFSVGKYSAAIRWSNQVLNDNQIRTAEDLHASTRILTLLLQFELGRRELLEYLARSTYRFLSKLEGLYRFEELMLAFMKRVSKKDASRNDLNLYQELKAQLQQTRYEPGERNALSTIDLISWVDSKLENRPLHEILKAKNTHG